MIDAFQLQEISLYFWLEYQKDFNFNKTGRFTTCLPVRPVDLSSHVCCGPIAQIFIQEKDKVPGLTIDLRQQRIDGNEMLGSAVVFGVALVGRWHLRETIIILR